MIKKNKRGERIIKESISSKSDEEKREYAIKKAEELREKAETHPNVKETLTYVSNDVLQLIIENKKPKATELIVNFIKKNNDVKTTRNDDRNEVWIYKDGIYVPEGKSYIQEITRKILGTGYTTNLVNQVISKIEVIIIKKWM